MKKNEKKWQNYLSEAREYDSRVSKSLTKAVQLFMKEKGFDDSVAELFDMDFASGHETVITFNNEGEFCDLDITTAKDMSKDEIIKKLSRELSPRSVKLLKGEDPYDDCSNVTLGKQG